MDIFIFPGKLGLGTKVRIARVGRHWTQADLASQADVVQSLVSALERDLTIYAGAEIRILQCLGLLSDGIERYQKLSETYKDTPRLVALFEKRRKRLEVCMREG